MARDDGSRIARMLPPEERYLLRLGSTRGEPPRVDGLRPARLLAVAAAWGLSALLRRRWTTDATLPALLDAPATEQLRRLGMASDFAMQYTRRRLVETVGALARAQVACMPLKGAAFLLESPESGLDRPMADIDLLIHPTDSLRAQAALLDCGWTSPRDSGIRAFYQGHHHLPPFDDRSRTGLYVELHLELFPPGHPFDLAASALWATARASVAHPGTYLPGHLEQLLHACVHFAWSHMAEKGLWRAMHDVDVLSACPGLDWGALVGRAHAARAASACYWTLRLARDLRGAPVPDAVLDDLAPPSPAWLRGPLARHLAVISAGLASCPWRRLQRGLWAATFRPGASGHGGARPWARSDLYDQGDSADAAGDRPAVVDTRLVQWRRYLDGLRGFAPHARGPSALRALT
jgi:hypothetical protein